MMPMPTSDEPQVANERPAHDILLARLLASDEVRTMAATSDEAGFIAWLAANIRRINDERTAAQSARIFGSERNFARAVRGVTAAVWLDIRARAQWHDAMSAVESE